MRDRRLLGLGLLGVVASVLAVSHPRADIRIITSDVPDPAPHRLQVALDTGLGGISLLVTWTVRDLARRR